MEMKFLIVTALTSCVMFLLMHSTNGMDMAMDGTHDMGDMNNKNKSTNDSGMGMQMHMYFYTGKMVTLFFKDWMTHTDTEYNGACTALAILAILFEGLKVLRQWLTAKQMTKNSPGQSFTKDRIVLHLIQTILHIIQVFLGYMLMLAFMTYNAGVCVSVLLGYGVGYLVFAWFSPQAKVGGDDSDCCNM